MALRPVLANGLPFSANSASISRFMPALADLYDMIMPSVHPTWTSCVVACPSVFRHLIRLLVNKSVAHSFVCHKMFQGEQTQTAIAARTGMKEA